MKNLYTLKCVNILKLLKPHIPKQVISEKLKHHPTKITVGQLYDIDDGETLTNLFGLLSIKQRQNTFDNLSEQQLASCLTEIFEFCSKEQQEKLIKIIEFLSEEDFDSKDPYSSKLTSIVYILPLTNNKTDVIKVLDSMTNTQQKIIGVGKLSKNADTKLRISLEDILQRVSRENIKTCVLTLNSFPMQLRIMKLARFTDAEQKEMINQISANNQMSVIASLL